MQDVRDAAVLPITAVHDPIMQLRQRHATSETGTTQGSLPGSTHPPQQQQQQYRPALLVAAACLGWVAASSGAILVNKHIMVDLGFKYPAAVAAMGMVGTSAASFLVVGVLRLVPAHTHMTPRFFVSSILPTGLFMAWTFLAGNMSYLYLTVSFVQMLKALTPVTTMLCAFAFQLERATIPLIASITLITLGVMVASMGELNFHVLGVLSMLSSVAAEGLRLVLMQNLVLRKQMHSLEALLYLAPACSFWLLLYVGMFELPRMVEQKVLGIVLQSPGMFLVSGCIGFGVNGMAMAVISLASALTLKVLGIVKDVGLVTLGVVLFGDKVSPLQVWGYLVSLVGFVWYNHLKMAPKPSAGDSGHSGHGHKG